MMTKNVIITALIVLLVGAGSFFAGIKYQAGKRTALSRQFVPGQETRPGQGGQGNGTIRAGFRPVAGEITTSDEKSITVKLKDGSSKIVLISDKTAINKASVVAKEDLKSGEQVAVFGTENPDGSVTAQNIQLNPVQQGLTPEN